MNRDEALKLLRAGSEGIAEWNRRREAGEEIPPLDSADLRNAMLVDADLSNANLGGADLRGAKLSNASNASLARSNLSGANLGGADLRHADLTRANLGGAILSGSELNSTDLRLADLNGADLRGATLNRCNLPGTVFADARWGWTKLTDVDLREAIGLGSAVFSGPSSIGVDTLVRSKGQVPESFLRGCGFQPWQVIQAKTYDPALTRDQFTDLLYKVDIARNQGPLFIGGVFISYSHDDAKFVDKMHGRLEGEGAPVWLDRHDLLAGALQKQVDRAIRLNNVVLLVLSESSVNSDWVKHELRMARKKEKVEGRDILCPVALDDSWKAKKEDVLWENVLEKNVLDFSKWKTKAFERQYQKLTAGLKVNYGPAPAGPATGVQ